MTRSSGCAAIRRGLRQVLANLMSNALKFTDLGSVSLTVSNDGDHLAQAGSHPKARMRFIIEDTGVGMPPGILPNLFSPFVQGEGSTTRRYGGSGLGLAICKQLIALMGGAIDVESMLGKGSRFVVQVPELETTEPLCSKSWTPRFNPTSLPKRLHVLVAEEAIPLTNSRRATPARTPRLLGGRRRHRHSGGSSPPSGEVRSDLDGLSDARIGWIRRGPPHSYREPPGSRTHHRPDRAGLSGR